MSRFYYKTRQVLQNEPIITKRDTTVECAVNNSNREAARKFSVDERRILKLQGNLVLTREEFVNGEKI